MNKTYIQFTAPENNSGSKKEGRGLKSTLENLTISLLTKVIPKANPDFDDKTENVKYWLVECNSETGIPEREIGLDKTGNPIMKMPFRKNYGYWTDNNFSLSDFKEHFEVSEISADSFEQEWNLFDQLSDFTVVINEFKILKTGSDGGHIYLATVVDFKGKKRKLVIYFADKADERKIEIGKKLIIIGELMDEGEDNSLSLLNSRLIKVE